MHFLFPACTSHFIRFPPFSDLITKELHEGIETFSSSLAPFTFHTFQPNKPFGIGGLSSGVKRPRREANSSPQTNAYVKNIWTYTATPKRLHGVVLN
jgi:hypothetical protein